MRDLDSRAVRSPRPYFARESGSPAWLDITVDLEPGGIIVHCLGRTNQTGARAVLGWSGGNSLAAGDLRFERSLVDWVHPGRTA